MNQVRFYDNIMIDYKSTLTKCKKVKGIYPHFEDPIKMIVRNEITWFW